MSVEVYTIEHTGTRFVLDILDRAGLGKMGGPKRNLEPGRPDLGVTFPQRKNADLTLPLRCHCNMHLPKEGTDPRYPNGWEEPGPDTPLVVTVRNPFEVLRSWSRRKTKVDLMPRFIATWAHYLWRLRNRKAFYFALDVEPKQRQAQIEGLLDYCGLPQQPWVEQHARNWSRVGASKYLPGDSMPITDAMKAQLQFAKEWYDDHTVAWGVQ